MIIVKPMKTEKKVRLFLKSRLATLEYFILNFHKNIMKAVKESKERVTIKKGNNN